LPTSTRKLSHQQVPFVAIGFILAIGFIGCSSETDVASTSSNQVGSTQTTPAAEKPVTTSVAISRPEAGVSPAVNSTDLPVPEASPAEVCRVFMELLKTGNRVSAENLLTRAALTATTKAGLQLEPIGGATARYEMGMIRYATIQNELAQVDCTVIDQIDGAEVKSEVTWLVRKQNLGWRVAGLLVDVDNSSSKDLLSFESLHDVAKIKSLAAGEAISEQSRQASAPSDGSILK
jgi:hypothetical protein